MILRRITRPVGVGLAVFSAMAGLYQLTRAPSVTFIDAGELAAVAALLGIAHPTGYPLFTLLGRLVAAVPIASEEIVRLNVFASLLTALAVAVVYGLLLQLGRSGKGNRRNAGGESWQELGLAAAGACVFGTATTVWAQSVALEVYALHLALVTLSLATFIAGLREQQRRPQELSRRLVLAAFLLGLSFSNHLTTLLVLPGLGYLSVTRLSLTRRSLARFVKLAPWFFLGLSPYVYLFVRSSAGPPLDWGHPSSLGRFLWHVSGTQYRTWIFSGFDSASRQLEYFATRLPQEYSWVALALALAGFVMLWKDNRQVFWFLAILFVSCVAYAINYDIHDIDSYFLLAHLALGLAAGHGMREMAMLVTVRLPRVMRGVVPAACAGLVLLQLLTHRSAVDQSDQYLVEDYTRSILSSVDSNAVILSYQWDYFVSGSLYYQHVRGMRPDVAVIDKELLRRSWYFISLERNWPWLIGRTRPAIERFLGELRKFEGGLPYRPEVIEASFNGMINAMILASLEDRPVYVGPEIEPQFAPGLERVPAGLLFRLRRPGSAVPDTVWKPFSLRPSAYRDRLTEGLRYQCAKMLVFRALWLTRQGFHSIALASLDSAAFYSPSMPEIRALRSEIELLSRTPVRLRQEPRF